MSFEEVTKSVDLLCAQLSIMNIAVPRFDKYKDVFDFINEFETVTATLPSEHKVKLLVKAFPPGRLMSWYEHELKPLIEQSKPWLTLKDTIISRYSDTKDLDHHLLRLKRLRFDPNGQDKLVDYVEDVSYSFVRAFPSEDEASRIRYIKAAMPIEIESPLAVISEYYYAKDYKELLRGVRRYDNLKKDKPPEVTPRGSVDNSQLVTLLTELVKEVKQTRTPRGVVAAMPTHSRDSSPHERQSRRDNQRDYPQRNHQTPMSPDRRAPRQATPPRRQEFVDRNSYNDQVNNYPDTKPYSHQYQAYANQRPSSPSRAVGYRGNSPVKAIAAPNEAGPSKEAHTQRGSNIKAFNENEYYKKFGIPPYPCSECGYMHWARHCTIHLK